MLPARPAAPSPMRLKRMLTANTTGRVSSVGSHRSRHSGSRRNANASTGGTRKMSAEAIPDSIPCASACQDVFSHTSSMPPQSSRRKPSRNLVTPRIASPRTPRRASQPGPSARQRPSAKATIRSPVRFAAIWLYSHAWFAVCAPISLMLSLAGLNSSDWARSPRTRPTMKLTGARSPQIAAARSGTRRYSQTRGQRAQEAASSARSPGAHAARSAAGCTEGSGFQRAISSASISS